MGFSLLSAFGGAAKQLSAEYAQDRLDEKRRQTQITKPGKELLWV